jgi:hypothetical protein
MPIRINLLAEEQAAEEMRRRDPVKRAFFAGVALVILMIGWMGITQMSVMAARSDLANLETRLKDVDESSRQAKANQQALAEGQQKLRSLGNYSRNRFAWGTFLDNIQRVSLETIRLMEIKADQKYSAGDVNSKFFTTNVTVKYTPPPGFWPWGKRETAIPVTTLVSNTFPSFTDKPPFTTNTVQYSAKITPVSTNKTDNQIVARADFSTVPWAMERVVVEIRGRDYGQPSGAAIDELARHIHASAYFKEILEPESEDGFRFTERPPQARPDPQDPLNPNALFVPFTIELTLKERVLTNE